MVDNNDSGKHCDSGIKSSKGEAEQNVVLTSTQGESGHFVLWRHPLT